MREALALLVLRGAHGLVGVAVPAWAAEGGWGWLSLSSQQLSLVRSAQISQNALDSFRIKGTM